MRIHTWTWKGRGYALLLWAPAEDRETWEPRFERVLEPVELSEPDGE